MTTNTSLERLQQLLPQLFQPIEVIGDPYLRFQLTPEIPVLLSMERVQEALVVPASSISPLPNLPAFSIGLMNARDRVFLAVDLAQLLGFPPLPNNLRNYQIIVTHLPSTIPDSRNSDLFLSEKCLGLAVRDLKGVIRYEAKTLQPLVREVHPFLKPYLLGGFIETKEQVLVLDVMAAIANSFSSS